jgi:hypothetical protein
MYANIDTVMDLRQKDNMLPKLVISIIIINLLIYALVGFSLYNSHVHYHKVASTSTQNMAKNLEINISGIFDKIDFGVSTLSHEAMKQLATGGANQEELNSYIQNQLTQLPELHGLQVSDADGNLLYGTDLPSGASANISDRKYFKCLRENKKEGLVISNATNGSTSGKWNITFARRISRQDGSFVGVAIAVFDVVYLDRFFSQLDLGKHGAIEIRDLDFCLVAVQPVGKELGSQVGSNVISTKTKEMILTNPEDATYKTVIARDNLERVVTFHKVVKYPFYIFVTKAPIDYMARWNTEAAITLILLAIFTLSTIILVRIFISGIKAKIAHSMAIQYGEEMSRKNDELIEALSRIKRLEGIIPICMHCKKIRDDQNSWNQLEQYITNHSEAMFSHGICPSCYEEQMLSIKNSKTST